jgi:hypothetical protein
LRLRVTSNQAGQAARQLLTAFSRLPQLHRDPAQCSAFLEEMLAAYPLYLNFGVAEPGGDLRCSAAADRMYFKTAMRTGQFAIGDYQIGRVTRLPSINYGYPLANSSGTVEGLSLRRKA